MTVREKVGTNDFRKIASNHQYFIWHFLQRNQNETRLGLFSYFDKSPNDAKINQIKYLLENIEIPYFESYVEDSMDFLMDLGLSPFFLYKPIIHNESLEKSRKYSPLFLGFNKFKLIGGSYQVCYCPEYFIELVAKLNPDYILNSTFD